MWTATLLAAGALTLAACAPADTQPEAADPTPAVTQEAPPPAQADEAPEPAPEPDPAAGLWDTEGDYIADVIDSSEKITEMLGLLADATDLYAVCGTPCADDMLDIVASFRAALGTHIDHFDGTTPPDRFADSHTDMMTAWDYWDRSAVALAEGVRTDDVTLVHEATDLMWRGAEYMESATDNLPVG